MLLWPDFIEISSLSVSQWHSKWHCADFEENISALQRLPFPGSPPPQDSGLAFFLLWWEERRMAGVGAKKRDQLGLLLFTWYLIGSRHLLLAHQYRNRMDSSVGGISFCSIKLISILPHWWGMRNCWTCCPSDEIKEGTCTGALNNRWRLSLGRSCWSERSHPTLT